MLRKTALNRRTRYIFNCCQPPATFTISSMSNPFNSEVDGRCYRFSHLVLIYDREVKGRKRCEWKARHQVNEPSYSLPYPIFGREPSVWNTETRAPYGDEATLTCGPSALPTGAMLEQLRPWSLRTRRLYVLSHRFWRACPCLGLFPTMFLLECSG